MKTPYVMLYYAHFALFEGMSKHEKIVALLLVFVFAFVLSACNDHNTTTESENITKGDGTFTSTTNIETGSTATKENDTSKTTTSESKNATKENSASEFTTSTGTENTTKKDAASSESVTTTTKNRKTSTKPTTTSTKPTTTTTVAPTTTSTQSTQTTQPVHTHAYSPATCTEPAKCSCGTTQGSALGHTWQEATCQAPKTCSVCKKIEGEKGTHNYTKGICAVCGDKQVINPKIGLKENADYFEENETPYGFSLTVWRFNNSSLTIRDEPWGVYAQDTEWTGDDSDDPGDAIFYNGKSYYPVYYGDLGSPKYTLTDTEIIITYDSGHHADEGHEYRLVVNYEYDLEVVYAQGGVFEEGSILKLVE